jgi:hypothetical protein
METFTISDKDAKKIAEFVREQDKLTGKRYGAIGGAYKYSFTPTSIGVVFTVENTVTKAVLDLSDYENW